MATGDSSFVFSEDEVQQELARLGITNIDKASLQQFRHELQDLIQEVSASSAGFPDVSSSTSAGINNNNNNGTCSDMSTTEEETKHMARSSQSSSQSTLSIPSPLLTPPLGKNNSDIPMSLCVNLPDRPGRSYGGVGHITAWGVPTSSSSSPRQNPQLGRPEKSYGDVGHIRTAWEDPIGKHPTVFPPPPPPQWKNPQLGRTRQVNLNSGSNHPSNVGNSTVGFQPQGNRSLFNGRYPQEEEEDVSPNPSTIPQETAFEIGISDRNEVLKSTHDITDYRLRDKENVMKTSYNTRSFTTLLQPPPPGPPGTKKEEPVLHDIGIQNGNALLEELLRVYNNSSPETRTNVVVPPAKKFTKRKIVRKDSEGKSYVDESYTESDSGSLLDPVEYMERLREMNKSIYDIAGEEGSSDRASDFYHPTRAPLSATDNRPKSVILTPTTPPKLKKNKKSDPVNRYHQFRDYWAHHKVPGESRHNELRWYIKERMLHQDQIESRPRKVYVPNNYVVPTEKHRNSLRWQIRTDLAYGFMPSSRDSNY